MGSKDQIYFTIRKWPCLSKFHFKTNFYSAHIYMTVHFWVALWPYTNDRPNSPMTVPFWHRRHFHYGLFSLFPFEDRLVLKGTIISDKSGRQDPFDVMDKSGHFCQSKVRISIPWSNIWTCQVGDFDETFIFWLAYGHVLQTICPW